MHQNAHRVALAPLLFSRVKIVKSFLPSFIDGRSQQPRILKIRKGTSGWGSLSHRLLPLHLLYDKTLYHLLTGTSCALSCGCKAACIAAQEVLSVYSGRFLISVSSCLSRAKKGSG